MVRDRRKQPTLAFSKYTLFGHRSSFRRETDKQRGGYVDRYSPRLFFILILILGLNILDAFLTMIILAHSGWEINPLVRSAIEVYGDKFWIWKYAIVSGALIFLCLHSNFRQTKSLLLGVCSVYIAVVVYQVFLITYSMPGIP